MNINKILNNLAMKAIVKLKEILRRYKVIVYVVYTEGWDWESRPELNRIFFNKHDAESYAETLRNKVYDNWTLSCSNKVYWKVSVEPQQIY
jgi:hypothetical protein